MGSAFRSRKSAVVFAAGLAALLTILFFPVWGKGEALFARDLYNFHYPLWKLTADQFARAGRIPLWNPAANFGQNMAADPNYLVLYPPAWIRFAVEPLAALHIFIIGHLFLGGILFRILMKKWRFGPAIANIASIGYVFCGATMSLTCLLTLVPWIAYTPLFLLTFQSLWANPGWRSSIRLGLVGALGVTIFEPFMALGLALCAFASAYVLICLPRRPKPAFGPIVAWSACGLALAVVFSAPFWCEAARNLSQSARTVETPIDRELYARHPAQLVALFVPNPFRVGFGMERTYRGGAYSQGQEPFLLSLFLGTATLFLVPYAFAGKKRMHALAIAALFLTLAFLSAGPNLPLSGEILRLMPLVEKARYPDKLMFFASAAWLVLAACGLTVLRRNRMNGLRPGMPWLAVGFALYAGIGLLSFAIPGSSAVSFLPWSLISAVGVACFCLRPRNLAPSCRLGGIAALLVLEWVGGNAYVTPSAPREVYTESVPVLDAIRKREGDIHNFRVTCDQFPPNWRYKGKTDSIAWSYRVFRQAGLPSTGYGYGILYGFDTVFDNLDPLAMASLRQLYPSLSEGDRQALCRRTGVRWLLSTRLNNAFRLEGIFPTGAEVAIGAWRSDSHNLRAVVMTAVSESNVHDDVLERLLHAPSGVVALPAQAKTGNESISRPGTGESYPATVVTDDGDHVVVETSAPKPGVLVLRDTFDEGWTAFVDGQASRVFLADYLFRGVLVPEGHHQVTFVFFPPGWTWMLPLAGCAAAIAVLGTLMPPGRRATG